MTSELLHGRALRYLLIVVLAPLIVGAGVRALANRGRGRLRLRQRRSFSPVVASMRR